MHQLAYTWLTAFIILQPLYAFAAGPRTPLWPVTVRQHIDWTDGSLIAMLSPGQELLAIDRVEYIVLHVLRQPTGSDLVSGDRIVVHITSKVPSFLVLAAGRAEKDKPIEWTDQREVSPRSIEYILAMAGTNADGDALQLCLAFIESDDDTVSADVHYELGGARLRDLTKLRSKLSRARLEAMFNDERIVWRHKSTYGLLLGICGDRGTEKLLYEAVVTSLKSDEQRKDNRRLICGYLLLAGNEGLLKLSHLSTAKRESSFLEAYSGYGAMAVMVHEAPDRFDNALLCELLRPLLDRKDFADIVIPTLAVLKDWEIQGRLANLYSTANDFAYPDGVRKAVVSYMKASERDIPRKSTSLPQHAIEATKFLKTLP